MKLVRKIALTHLNLTSISSGPFIYIMTHIDKLDMGIELLGQGDVGLLDTKNLLLVRPLFEASFRGPHCKMLRRLANWQWGRQHSCITLICAGRFLPIGSVVDMLQNQVTQG